MKHEKKYLSYLLRLWRVGNKDPLQWRASLEKPLTGNCEGFASLAELFAFLETETGMRLPDSDHQNHKADNE